MEAVSSVPVPPQLKPPRMIDYRRAANGPKGYKERSKRKLDEYQEQVYQEANQMDEGNEAPTVQPPAKKYKFNAVGVGKASGRTWKVPGERAGTLKPATLATSWDKKMADKQAHKVFKELREEVADARKDKAAAERRRREALKQKKLENQQKSAVKQKITKTATLKKMMKSRKERKKLITGDAT